MDIRYSFIIPVKYINSYIKESIPKILEINRSDYEILIFPDESDVQFSWEKTRQIATGSIGPAEKRDLALEHAKGDFFIFLDDDAFPKNNFLDILDETFLDTSIVAAGGPAITPKSDSFWQKVSGAVFLSRLSGGFPERYRPIGKKRLIDDWPSVNLTVRRETFKRVGGFNSKYWPGEDTKLCLDIVQKEHGKIIYNPELIVWHHRRAGLIKHLRQVGRYGLHRGFFAKKFPQTSLRCLYFIPSIFLLFAVLTPLLILIDPIRSFVLIGWILYLAALGKAFWDIYSFERNKYIALGSLGYIFATHLIYGYQFINGFIFIKTLNSELRK